MLHSKSLVLHLNEIAEFLWYRVFTKYCVFFSRILESLPPLPRQQHSAAIGCTKNYQPIGVILYTRIALRALKVSYSDVGERGVAVNCEKKTQFFLKTL